MKNRGTGRVKAFTIETADRKTLHNAIYFNIDSGANVYSDDFASYKDLIGYNHKSVKHSVGQYVSGKAHTNGIESFWALLKRGYYGTFHHFSAKHLQRYVDEFAERQNTLSMEPIERFAHFVKIACGND